VRAKKIYVAMQSEGGRKTLAYRERTCNMFAEATSREPR
jgi:hypothetical protein